nr:uncharacterized protein CTRU02_15733 [Colletotrichum truncatum]KAF6780739.1 hypothetical protein CTRU02_15733 [Colletotrichum truncatum]
MLAVTFNLSFLGVVHGLVLYSAGRSQFPPGVAFILGQCVGLLFGHDFHRLCLYLWCAYWFVWFCRRRYHYKRLSPGLPHSFLLGHLLLMRNTKSSLPADIHIHVVISILSDTYNMRQHGVFYLDLYPVQLEPFMVAISPEAIQQATMYLGKHTPAYSRYEPVVGKGTIILSNGSLWKETRALFNPFFSHSRLQSFVPAMVQEGMTLITKLEHAASANARIDSLEDIFSDALADITGQIILGTSLQAQASSENLKTKLAQLSCLICTNRLASYLSKYNIGPGRQVNQMARESSEQVRSLILQRLSHLRAHRCQTEHGTELKRSNISVVDALLSQHITKDGSLSGIQVDALVENVKNIILPESIQAPLSLHMLCMNCHTTKNTSTFKT